MQASKPQMILCMHTVSTKPFSAQSRDAGEKSFITLGSGCVVCNCQRCRCILEGKKDKLQTGCSNESGLEIRLEYVILI